MGTWYLYTGAVSDSVYNSDNSDLKFSILRIQREFASRDLVQKKTTDSDVIEQIIIPFTNCTNKGYCITIAAWQYGQQLVLQPDFKTSDIKFTDKQNISSSTVASHRSANERAVKYSKRWGALNVKECGNADYTRVDDIWLASSFQCNFLLKPVL